MTVTVIYYNQSIQAVSQAVGLDLSFHFMVKVFLSCEENILKNAKSVSKSHMDIIFFIFVLLLISCIISKIYGTTKRNQIYK